MKAYRLINGALNEYIEELSKDGCNVSSEFTNNKTYFERDINELKYDILCLSRLNHVGFVELYEADEDGDFKWGSDYYEYEDFMKNN